MLPDVLSHSDLTPQQLFHLLRKQHVRLSGNRRLKIYGLLNCPAGRRMKRENRVFFQHEAHALQAGYRPCSICLPQAYTTWKNARSGLKTGS